MRNPITSDGGIWIVPSTILIGLLFLLFIVGVASVFS